MLNSQQNFQWSFNSSTGNTTQLSQPNSLRGLPSYIQNEQQTLFINPTETPPAWSSTSKCSQDWHSGLSPNSYEFIEKAKNIHVGYGCGSNFADKYGHQTILSLNTLTDE